MDTTAAKKIPGVIYIHDNDLIATLHGAAKPPLGGSSLRFIRLGLNLPPTRKTIARFRSPAQSRATAADRGREGGLAVEELATGVVELLDRLGRTCGDGSALRAVRHNQRRIDCWASTQTTLPFADSDSRRSASRRKTYGYHPVCGWRIRRQERVAPSGGTARLAGSRGEPVTGGGTRGQE